MGDSIASFAGYITPGNPARYPDRDVMNWTDTWWGQVISQSPQLALLVNNSSAGACISDQVGRGAPYLSGLTAIRHLSWHNLDPDIIFFTMGTNDTIYESPKTFEENYTTALNRAKERYPKAQIFLATLLYRNKHVDASYDPKPCNAIISSLAKNFHYGLIDFAQCGVRANNADQTLLDGLHPNLSGHTLMAQEARRSLAPYLEKLSPADKSSKS